MSSKAIQVFGKNISFRFIIMKIETIVVMLGKINR